ncbi:MAG: hypothetical protein RL684_1534 [Pseudomonadota bacterium]|jgi:hypothetical protein
MIRRIRPLLLALALLLSQQAGIAHLTGHAAQRLREQPVPAQGENHDCTQCVLYAALGAAPLSALVAPAVVPAGVPQAIEFPLARTVARAALAYRSRAPPPVA